MKIVQNIAQIRLETQAARQRGQKVYFVPTMGSLHEGHMSLVKNALEHGAGKASSKSSRPFVVMSIYVNPTQFNSEQDLVTYPRNLASDEVLASEAGVDLLFIPPDQQMYDPQLPASDLTRVVAGSLANGYCGKYRSGHFDGVVTVVAKLFNIVQPDFAVFGEKDFQQLQVVKQMVRDLCFPVEIIPAKLIRDPDGLALSSRNSRLSPDQRIAALLLSQALFSAKEMAKRGILDASVIESAVRKMLDSNPQIQIEYVTLVDSETLLPLDILKRGARLLVAVHVGNTRLIDNLDLALPNP